MLKFIQRIIFLWIYLIPAGSFAQITRDTLWLDEVEISETGLKHYPELLLRVPMIRSSVVRDIGDLLRQEPNVAGIRKGGIGIDPVIRGFKYNQVTIILNDGVKIEGGCPNRMDPVASHTESEILSNIRIFKGPYVLKYGPVMGALINLTTETARPWDVPSLQGEVLYGFETNWNGQREHFALSGGNRRIFFHASGGFKGYGSYTAGTGELIPSSFQKRYAFGSAGFVPAENHRIVVNYMYDQGNNVRFPALPMDERLDQTHVASLRYSADKPLPWLHSMLFQPYFSSVHHVMDNRDRATFKTMQAETVVDAYNTGGRLEGKSISGLFSVLAGMDFEYIGKDGQKRMTMQMISGSDTMTSVRFVNVYNHARYTNTGLFCEFGLPLEHVDFSASVRFDFNTAGSRDTFRLIRNGTEYFSDLTSAFFNPSFGLGAGFDLGSGFRLITSAGLGTRSPSILERFIKLMPVQYDTYDYLGNPTLRPEKNWQTDISLRWKNEALGSISLGGFFSYITDYISGVVLPPAVIKPSTQGAPGVKQFMNIQAVYLTGFEFSYQSPPDEPWNVAINGAATFGVQPSAHRYMVTEGNQLQEATVNNDPMPEIAPAEGNAVFSYRFFGKTLIPSVRLRLVAPQNRVSVVYGEQPTPGFFTAGLSVSFHPSRFATIVAGVENITGQAYYEHLNRRIVGSLSPLYEPGRYFFITTSFKFGHGCGSAAH